MENKETVSSTINTDNDSNNLSGNLFQSPITSRDDQLEFDFSSGELFNPASSCTLIFPPKFIPQSQLSFSSPSDCSFDDEVFSADAIATENRLSQASFILEYQQLYNCYTVCLTSLQESVKEVDALRQKNDALRLANNDLGRRLNMFSQATTQNRLVSSVRTSSSPSSTLIGDFSRLGIGAAFCESTSVEKVPSVSPTSVIEPKRFERHVNGDRVPMPKSISVRSKGFLKSVSSQRPNRQQAANASLGQSQRVRVPGEKKAGEGMEFEVYNQGMSKTELCNKWQETGICPYGDSCHFAHGISELRPVIRHPRYKTEVCRMVLAGDICPYGHRCHFRHALTDEEMLLAVNQS